MRLCRTLFAACLGLAAIGPAVAAGQWYRCTQDGRTTYSDTPCELPQALRSPGSPDATPETMAAPPLPPVFGDWHGQAQYQLSAAGQSVAEAHAVVALTLSLNAEGKVVGNSPENACRLLGLWIHGFAPSVLELDVTLSRCSHPGLNHRYHGQLTESADGHSGQLTLSALGEGSIDARFNAELKANLRR